MALGRIGIAALPSLLVAATNAQVLNRALAVQIFCDYFCNSTNRVDAPEYRPIVVQFARDTDGAVASDGIRALTRFQLNVAVPVLIQLLQDGPPGVRPTAAWALGQFGPNGSSAEPALRKALEDSDAELRKYATKRCARLRRQS
jgi:HEAT repeat protein